jgi:hypothetical protein
MCQVNSSLSTLELCDLSQRVSTSLLAKKRKMPNLPRRAQNVKKIVCVTLHGARPVPPCSTHGAPPCNTHGAPPCSTHGAPPCSTHDAPPWFSSMQHPWCSSTVLHHAAPMMLPHDAPPCSTHGAPLCYSYCTPHTIILLSKCLGNQAKVYAAGNKEPHLFSSVFGVSVPCCESVISKTSSLSIRFPGCIQASGEWQAGRGLWARLMTLNGRWSLRCRQQPHWLIL